MTEKRTKQEIIDWVVDWIAEEVKLDKEDVDIEQPFVNFGMGSRQAVLLAAELEDFTGVTLEPDAAWEFPTIASLAENVEQQQSSS